MSFPGYIGANRSSLQELGIIPELVTSDHLQEQRRDCRLASFQNQAASSGGLGSNNAQAHAWMHQLHTARLHVLRARFESQGGRPIVDHHRDLWIDIDQECQAAQGVLEALAKVSDPYGIQGVAQSLLDALPQGT